MLGSADHTRGAACSDCIVLVSCSAVPRSSGTCPHWGVPTEQVSGALAVFALGFGGVWPWPLRSRPGTPASSARAWSRAGPLPSHCWILNPVKTKFPNWSLFLICFGNWDTQNPTFSSLLTLLFGVLSLSYFCLSYFPSSTFSSTSCFTFPHIHKLHYNLFCVSQNGLIFFWTRFSTNPFKENFFLITV